MALPPQEFCLERDIALSRAQTWQLLSNTDHLNRAVGLPEVLFAPLPEDKATLYREARTRLGGVAMRYREYPFDWVAEREYSVRRVFEGGPLAQIVAGIHLDDSQSVPNGTRLEFYAHVTPANVVGVALASAVAGNSMRKMWRYVRDHVTHASCASREEEGKGEQAEQPLQVLAEVGASSFPSSETAAALGLPAPSRPPTVNAAALENAVRRLRGLPREAWRARLDGDVIMRLARWIVSRGDDEIASLRPFHLAREWGSDPEQTLRVFLYGARSGLLNLSWNLMCPNCRVSKAEEGHLEAVTSPFHCDACGISYEAGFDRAIELRFHPNPDVREAHASVYCIGGPFVTPHILVQHLIPAGQSHALPVPETPDDLRARVFRFNHSLRLEDGAEAPEKITYTDTGWVLEAVAPRDGNLTVDNASGRDILVAIEKTAWDPLAVTAAQVTTMNEFRDLFGSEVLAPGQSVGVESLTLFFSDLKDSTEMYEATGDARAFGRVRAHFDFLQRHIEAHHGAIVKTLGDAVMAVFRSPVEAVQAAVEMQRDLPSFNEQLHEEWRRDAPQVLEEGERARAEPRPIVLKIGLHFGPAIAVTSNERLDYFGRTVNLASRIQNASQGGDVVVSGEVFERRDVRAYIQSSGVRVRTLQANLKGIEGVVELHHLSV